MVTAVGLEDEVADMLNSLSSLEYDAAETYRAAVEHLEEPVYQDAMSYFLADHLRHATELGAHVPFLGGIPAEGLELKATMTPPMQGTPIRDMSEPPHKWGCPSASGCWSTPTCRMNDGIAIWIEQALEDAK
jgi:hypothetical protein